MVDLTKSYERKSCVSFVIPIFNEIGSFQILVDYIYEIQNEIEEKCLLDNYEFIFIDDGSNDGSFEFIKSLALSNKNIVKIKCANHNRNYGYGAAIQSGIHLAKYDWILTFDADGQHSHATILKVLKEVLKSKNAFLFIGTRNKKEIISLRILGRVLLNWSEIIFLGSILKDSNSGLKCFDKNIYNAIDAIIPAPIDMSFSQHLAQTFHVLSPSAVLEVPINIDERKAGYSKIRLKDFFIAFRQNITLAYSLKPKRFYYTFAIVTFFITALYSLIIIYLNGAGMPVAGSVGIVMGSSFVILGELRQVERENNLVRLKSNIRKKYFLNVFKSDSNSKR